MHEVGKDAAHFSHQHDPRLAQQMELMQKGGNLFQTMESCDQETKDKLHSTMIGYMMAPTTFYCGCPIRVEGITVASLCCFGMKEPQGWCDKDVKAVEAIADKIGAGLEKEAQAMKFQNAQQVRFGPIFHRHRFSTPPSG